MVDGWTVSMHNINSIRRYNFNKTPRRPGPQIFEVMEFYFS